MYLVFGPERGKADCLPSIPRANGLSDFQGHCVEPFLRAAFGSAELGFHTPLTIKQLKPSCLWEIASHLCS